MTPPPTTTTRAWVGMLAGRELAAVIGIIVRMAWLACSRCRLASVAAPPGRKLGRISRQSRCGIRQCCAEHHTFERDLVLDFTDSLG